MNKKRPPCRRRFIQNTAPIRICLVDIETCPQEGKNWGGIREVDILEITRYSHMLSWAVKNFEGKTEVKALPDFPLYTRNKRSDKSLVKALHTKISSYDLIVAQNGDAFDLKYMNARFVYYGLTPLPPYKTVDTCKAARRYFLFPSNKLNELLLFLGYPPKVKTGGYDLWRSCLKGDPKAWKLMKQYNEYDVIGLEYVYKRLLPFILNHPNLNQGNLVCPSCGTSDIIKRGTRILFSKQPRTRYSCKRCFRHFDVR